MIPARILAAFVCFTECYEKTENKVIILLLNEGQCGLKLFWGTFSVNWRQRRFSSIQFWQIFSCKLEKLLLWGSAPLSPSSSSHNAWETASPEDVTPCWLPAELSQLPGTFLGMILHTASGISHLYSVLFIITWCKPEQWNIYSERPSVLMQGTFQQFGTQSPPQPLQLQWNSNCYLGRCCYMIFEGI